MKELSSGSLVDHFRVIRLLGRGGMATVYLARDTLLGRKVALKLIRPEALGSEEAVEGFLFEAQATARFNHGNIVTIFAIGRYQGVPYVALEYIEGHSLRRRMQRERLSLAECLRIGVAVAQALREAHGQQILHRDLKPDNIMLAADGRIKVVDFGLAKVCVSEKEQEGDQRIAGTPGYMPPEQWRVGAHTAAIDVWALAAVLYEMLCGRLPFSEEQVLQLGFAAGKKPAMLAFEPDLDLPAEFVSLLHDCLQGEADARPTAGQVAVDLQGLLLQVRGRQQTLVNPFRGLQPFLEEHQHLFFGRDAEIAAFVEQIRKRPIMPIVGLSGAGKSSFIQAGVIPRLRERGDLLVLNMRPGSQPFARLAEALVTAGSVGATDQLAEGLLAAPQRLNVVLQELAETKKCQVLLHIDQLEELFTLVKEENQREDFALAIFAAADEAESPVRVIFSVRDEFLGRLATVEGARRALAHITVLTRPQTESMHEILLRPVEALGYHYDDPNLVRDMVAEVEDEAACLPLLQFVGQKLWEGRDSEGRELLRSVYVALGGSAGAMARHANGVLATMNVDEIRLARQIFLRLVTPEGTRQVLARSLLLDRLSRGADQVLLRLESARLIISRQSKETQQSECELVHEALIQNWSRLARWINEAQEELLIVDQLNVAADWWEKRGRRDTDLWRGQPLREATQVAKFGAKLGSRAKRFLDQAKRKKSQRRLIWVTSLMLILLASSLSAVAGKAYWDRKACQGAQEKMTAVWNPEMQERIQTAFAAIEKPYACQAWQKARTTLQRYADDWVTMHEQACRATQVLGEQSPDLMDRRMLCLSERLGELDALVTVFAGADKQIVIEAAKAAHALAPLSGCADITALTALVKPPADTATRLRVAQVRKQLAQARAHLVTGKHDRANELARQVLTAASELAYPPLLAEAYYWQGRIQKALGEVEPSEKMLKEAWWQAEAAGHFEIAVLSTFALIETFGHAMTKMTAAEDYLRHARAFIERLGHKEEWMVQWHSEAGVIARQQDDFDGTVRHLETALELARQQGRSQNPQIAFILAELGLAMMENGQGEKAMAILDRALALYRELFGQDHPQTAVTLHVLCNAYKRSGDLDRALAHCQQALAVAASSFSAQHPLRAAFLDTLGWVYVGKGDYQKAIQKFQQSLAIREKSLTPNHPDVGASLNSFGAAYFLMGDYDRAIDYYQRCLRIVEETRGPNSPFAMFGLINLAEAYQEKNDTRSSLIHSRRAAAIAKETVGINHPSYASILLMMGKAHNANGQVGKAKQYFVQALQICSAKTCSAQIHAELQFSLARILWHSPRQRNRAIELARKAEARFARLQGWKKLRTEIRSWLENVERTGSGG